MNNTATDHMINPPFVVSLGMIFVDVFCKRPLRAQTYRGLRTYRMNKPYMTDAVRTVYWFMEGQKP